MDFDAAISRQQTALQAPAWLLELKRAARENFRQLPMPQTRDERWRFHQVKSLSLEGYHLPETIADDKIGAIIASSNQIKQAAGQMIFADDCLIQKTELAAEWRKKGVIWTSLREAWREHGDLLRQYFLTSSSGLGAEKFQALHDALVADGVFLYVPEGVAVDEPFAHYFWAAADGAALFPHTLVAAGKNARVRVVDFYGSAGAETKNLAVGNACLFAAGGAEVFRSAVQNWNAHTLAFHLETTAVQANATGKSVQINFGAGRLRHEHAATLGGAGGSAEMLSLNLAGGGQQFDQRALQHHAAPGTRSRLLYKNVVGGGARAIFGGLIRVEPDAYGTDASQSNRNLLLNADAETFSLPNLEILNDDVKCTHGVTTGQLSEEELFYLRSRGLPKSAAEELLVTAFLEEILAQLGNDELAESVRRHDRAQNLFRK